MKRDRDIVYVEQFFYPDGWSGAQLPRDIATALARSGFSIEVICGSDQYVKATDSSSDDPSSSGVLVRRIPRLFKSDDIKEKKLLRQLWFYAAVFPILLFRRRPKVYIAQTNPPLIVVILSIVAFIHRRPFLLIAMDLYPEVIFAHASLKEESLLGRALKTFFSWAYRRAIKVIALGPTMRNRLIEKGVHADRVDIISNWATGHEGVVRGEENSLLKKWNLQSCTTILYSGNIGLAHDVETPIRAFAAAYDRCSRLRLVFVGHGSQLNFAKQCAAELELKDVVSFRPLVPAEMLPESMGIADLALVTLRAGFEGLVVPSKLLGYMARGVPTIYIGPPSDAQYILEASKGGTAFESNEVVALADFMVAAAENPEWLDQMGRAALDYYSKKLSRAVGLARYRKAVEEVILVHEAG